MWLESSLFKSLELGKKHTQAHTSWWQGYSQSDKGALGFCQPQGKLTEGSGEREQRCAVLLTWQPSRHTNR